MQLASTPPVPATMRVAPFPSRIKSPDPVVSIEDAVRSTLVRWGGMWNAEIHPSRVRESRAPRTEQTIFATRELPKSSNVYLPRYEYSVHNWNVDPTPFFGAAQAVHVPGVPNRPDTITGAQLTQLFGSFDTNRDGLIRSDEYAQISAALGETWAYTGDSVELA